MRIEDCILARRMSGKVVGCKDNCTPLPECSDCGWSRQEDARRRRLPLLQGADGLYSRSEKGTKKRKNWRVKVVYTSPETGEETLYNSMGEAAEAAGISRSTMTLWLNRETMKECAKNWRYADGD